MKHPKPAARYLVVASVILLVATLVSPFHPTPEASATHTTDVIWRATLNLKNISAITVNPPLGAGGSLGQGIGCSSLGDTNTMTRGFSCEKAGVLEITDPLTKGELFGNNNAEGVGIYAINFRPTSFAKGNDFNVRIMTNPANEQTINRLAGKELKLTANGITISLGSGSRKSTTFHDRDEAEYTRNRARTTHFPHLNAGDNIELTLSNRSNQSPEDVAGDWDPTFGIKGRTFTETQPADSRIHAIAFHNDKIVAVGQVGTGVDSNFALARYNPDGSLDLSFGEGGRVITDIASGANDVARAVAIQRDGKIVVAGSGSGLISADNAEVVVARYNGDGSLDTTFDTDGIAIFSTNMTTGGSTEIGHSVAIMPTNDKIVVAGRFGVNWGLVRFTKAGALDDSVFNSMDGYLTQAFTGDGHSSAYAVAIQDNMRIMVAGETGDEVDGNTRSTQGDFALKRYNFSGTVDSTLTNANSTHSFSNDNDGARALAVLKTSGNNPTYSYALAGYSGDGDFAVSRVLASGALDTTFNSNGKKKVNFTGDDRAHAIAAFTGGDSERRLIVGGYTTNNTTDNHDFAIAQLSATGGLDSTFSSDGKITTDFNGKNDQINALLRNNNRIIAGGFATDNKGSNFALAAYKPNGTPDQTFGHGGKVTTGFSSIGKSDGEINAIIVQPDNKILAAGRTHDGDNYNVALVRYNVDGTLDRDFGTEGIATQAIGTSHDSQAFALARQSDGKIVVVGDVETTTDNADFAIARFSSNGTIDTSFGTNGIQTVEFNSIVFNSATAVAIQGDGKIVVGGGSDWEDDDGDPITAFDLVRLNTDGSVDTTFGVPGTGKISSTIPDIMRVVAGEDTTDTPTKARVKDISIVQGGAILAAGVSASRQSGGTFFLARYNSNGVLDTTSGTGITVSLFPTTRYTAESVSRDKSGKYLVGGLVVSTGSGLLLYSPFVSRFNANGTIDATFGAAGHSAIEKATTETTQEVSVLATKQQADGRILVAGNLENGRFVGRLLSDGTPDESFAKGGITTATFPGHFNSEAGAIAIDNNGKIVAAGKLVAPSKVTGTTKPTNYFAIARYLNKGVSSVATLKSLSIKGFTAADAAFTGPFSFHSPFQANTYSYSAALPPTVAKVEIGAAGSKANTNIRVRKVGGEWSWVLAGEQSERLTIRDGNNVANLEVEVFAGDNTTSRVYRINFGPPPNTLSALVVRSNSGNNVIALTPAFAASTTIYTANLPADDNNVKIRPTASVGSGATIEARVGSSGDYSPAITNGSLSSAFDVGSGINFLEIRVTVPNNNQKRTYRINFTLAPLATLTGFTGVLVGSGSSETPLAISPSFSAGTTFYSSILRATTPQSVKITPTAAAGTNIIVRKSGTMGPLVASGVASQEITVARGESIEIQASASAKRTNVYTINFKPPPPPPPPPGPVGPPPADVVDNAAPTFDESGPASRSITENSPANTPVGEPIAASDEDGDEVTYSLVGDSDLFTIDSESGQISVAEGAELDFETEPNTYTVTVAATDEEGSGEATQIEVVIDVDDQEVPDSVAAFDEDSDEEISLSELLSALSAYLGGEISVDELLEIIRHYLAS